MKTFILSAPLMRVTDPSYDRKTWCSGTFPALPGVWGYKVEEVVSGGRRIKSLRVFHEEHESAETTRELGITVGVDSGQCGFFDDAKYLGASIKDFDNPATFYGKVRKITNSPAMAGVVDGVGVVASSGYGDGVYTCKVAEQDEWVVAAEIVFIDQLEDDDE